MLQDYWQDIGLDLYKTECANKYRCKAATYAKVIERCAVISAAYYSVVLDKAYLVFLARDNANMHEERYFMVSKQKVEVRN